MGPLIALLALAADALPPQEAASALQRWEVHMTEAAERFGVPVDWIRSVMLVESGGRAALDGRPIRSPKGAMGLMQVMPATYAEMARLHGLGADPYLPRDNILAGTAYLRRMYDRFGYPGMFAAYNAGPERYAAFLRAGTPLPAETRAYMAKVGALAVSARPRSVAAVASRQGNGIFFRLAEAAGDDEPLPDTPYDPRLFVALRRK